MKKLSDADRAARLAFKDVPSYTSKTERREREETLHKKMAQQKAARLERDAALEKAAADDNDGK